MEQLRPERHAALRESLSVALLDCVALTIFCAALSLSLRWTLTAALDQTLRTAAGELGRYVELADGQLGLHAGWSDRPLAGGAETISGRLIARDGSVPAAFGRYLAETSSAPPPVDGSTTLSAADGAWRVYTTPVVAENGAQLGWLEVAASRARIDQTVATLSAQLLVALPLAFVAVAASALALQRRARPRAAWQPALTPGDTAPPADPPPAAEPDILLQEALAALEPPLAALDTTLDQALGRRATQRDHEAALRVGQQHVADLRAHLDALKRLAAPPDAPADGLGQHALVPLLREAVATLRTQLAAQGLAVADELGDGPALVGSRTALLQLCAALLGAAAERATGQTLTIRGTFDAAGYTLTIASAAPVRTLTLAPRHTHDRWLKLAAADALARQIDGSILVTSEPDHHVVALVLAVDATTEPLAIAVGGAAPHQRVDPSTAR